MKKFVMMVSLAALAIGVGAQRPPTKPAPPKTKIHCAVMTASTVDIAKATKSKMFTDYKGRRYFFCCAGCPEAFKANPKKYAKSESIPVPKAKKTNSA